MSSSPRSTAPFQLIILKIGCNPSKETLSRHFRVVTMTIAGCVLDILAKQAPKIKASDYHSRTRPPKNDSGKTQLTHPPKGIIICCSDSLFVGKSDWSWPSNMDSGWCNQRKQHIHRRTSYTKTLNFPWAFLDLDNLGEKVEGRKGRQLRDFPSAPGQSHLDLFYFLFMPRMHF